MSRWVVDASAVVAIALSSESIAPPDTNGHYAAPEIIIPEVLNARRKLSIAQRPTPDLVVVTQLLALIDIRSMKADVTVAVRLSEQLDHSLYDCFYVALCQRESLRLITYDQRLIRKLQHNNLGDVIETI